MKTAAIIPAGGSGSRVQQAVNKVYLPIRSGRCSPTLETFERAPSIDRVVLVIREEDRQQAEQVLSEIPVSKVTDVVEGGPTRHRSEMAGLDCLAPAIEADEVELVAIHDGARPFITLDLLEELIAVAAEHGGAVPGLSVEAPLYRIGDADVEPLPEASLRRMQTPQVFLAQPLLVAYRASIASGFEGVDTAETIERFTDLPVEVVEGDPRNIKVTFIEDFFQAEEWAVDWDKGRWLKS